MRMKKIKGLKRMVSQEEWSVRYDILDHALWLITKGLFVLDAFWYVLLLWFGRGERWFGLLVEMMAVPVGLWCVAMLFHKCVDYFSLPLPDGAVLFILDLTAMLILFGDRRSHSLQILCVLPVIMCVILGQPRLLYMQTAFAVLLEGAHFVWIEKYASIEWKMSVLINLSGTLYSILIVSYLIIQIRKYTKMLDTQTTIDSLTRLHNHEAFYEELGGKLAEYVAGQEPLSILIADIDNFKKVNDTYGHAYGDKVLKVLAGIFKEEESRKCFAARYGGEEFAMIMELNQSDALTKAQSIRKQFEQKKILTDNGLERSFTVSVGVAVYQPEYKTSSQFFEKADEALYKAKKGGKNRVCL